MDDPSDSCICTQNGPTKTQNRIEEKIETVIEDGRLARAKVEKHRECWPTAFYEQDSEGDPIFVDRMGILGTFMLPPSSAYPPDPPPLTPHPFTT